MPLTDIEKKKLHDKIEEDKKIHIPAKGKKNIYVYEIDEEEDVPKVEPPKKKPSKVKRGKNIKTDEEVPQNKFDGLINIAVGIIAGYCIYKYMS